MKKILPKYIHQERGFAPVLLILLVIVVALVGGYFYLKSTNPGALNGIPRVNEQQTPVAPQMQAQVTITDKGFSPATIKVKKGSQVTWTNLDKAPHLVASDPHPTHTLLPGLESPVLLSNDSYSFIFEKVGSFTYHDHLNPYKFKGTVIVE